MTYLTVLVSDVALLALPAGPALALAVHVLPLAAAQHRAHA